MPSEKQEFNFPGKTSEELLQIAYGTFLELAWTPRYAGPYAIVGYTPRSWKKYDDEILIETGDGVLNITSSLVHDEAFDMLKKNKKHIEDFIAAFDKVKERPVPANWAQAIEVLRRQTDKTVQEEVKQAQEVDKVMNLSGSNLYITYGLIAMNVIVFIFLALNGAGIMDANGWVHAKWGSNYTPLTLSGDWWRLISCMFIHFGAFHLIMNSYALYMAGVYLEPMLGKTKYLLAYLCTGVIASLVSLWWHKEGVNSAGASGAIFGLYGVFLGLLFTNLIPKQIRTSLLTSIGVFVVFNIFYGMKSGIDNAAHVGGLISGVLVGFLLYPVLKKRESGAKSNFAIFAVAVVTVIAAWAYLNNPGNRASAEAREATLTELREAKYPDYYKYADMTREFAMADENIIKMFNDDSKTDAEWLTKNESDINKEFEKATNIVMNMKRYDVSDEIKTRVGLYEQLLDARKEHFNSIKQLAVEDSPANQLKLAEAREKQKQVLDQLNKRN